MGVIWREKNTLSKRRLQYHKKAAMLVLCALFAARAWGQNFEGILIDTSGSISRGGSSNELFHEYLTATRKLLLSEPANTRVWVSSISADSFGGEHEILKGWTPNARRVFTDDLNRARQELASAFEVKSSGMAPVASNTVIFGGLWRMKAVLESGPKPGASPSLTRTIWIFSDMMNETKEFSMPALLELGSKQILERAKATGLIVPLDGYKIYIHGATTSGITPKSWITIRDFCIRYFAAAGAELVTYAAECNVQR